MALLGYEDIGKYREMIVVAAVGPGNEAVNFRNEAVKRTFCPSHIHNEDEISLV